MPRTAKADAWLNKALANILTPGPMPKDARVGTKKDEKEHDKMMRLADKELRRMGKAPPMTPSERRQMRAEQQRARRAHKAMLSVVL